MSGSLTRPDWAAALKDLGRRVGNLERRLQPRVVAPTTLPVRRSASISINMSNEKFSEVIELAPELDRYGIAATGPFGPVAAGHFIVYPQIDAPAYTSGSLMASVVILLVWDPAVTQRIQARYDNISLTSGQIWVPTTETVSTSMVIGTDLFIDANQRVRGPASSILLANLRVFFTSIPDPV